MVAWKTLPAWLVMLGVFFVFIIGAGGARLVFPALIYAWGVFLWPEEWMRLIWIAVGGYVLLGIKDLVIVNRRGAYRIFEMLGALALWYWTFRGLGSWSEGMILARGLISVPAWLLLVRGIGGWSSVSLGKDEWTVRGIVGLLMLEVIVALQLAPIDMLPQTGIALFMGTLLVDMCETATGGGLDKKRKMVYGAMFAAIMLVILLLPMGIR